jgi:Asp-tRNA(Asn)/Glu-tRNA(Gln) amidotransferase A subunit family amidase
MGGEPQVTAEELLNSWFERDTVRLQVLAQMEKYPVLLCPVCSVPAFRHGERAWEIEGQTVRYLDVFSYTQWFNLLGFPAVSVPVGRSPEGLPIGVQIVGRPWEEEVVLSVAEVVEREASGWQPPRL